MVKNIESYIPKELIPLWISYKNKNDEKALEKLILHYYETFCSRICHKIFNETYTHRYFSSYKEILSSTYEKLIKKIKEYDISKGYTFENFSYKAIYGSVIDFLRTQKVLIRKKIIHKINFFPLEFDKENKNSNILEFLEKKDLSLEQIDIDDFLESLPADYAFLFEEAIIHGKRYKEIKENNGNGLTRWYFNKAIKYSKEKLKKALE